MYTWNPIKRKQINQRHTQIRVIVFVKLLYLFAINWCSGIPYCRHFLSETKTSKIGLIQGLKAYLWSTLHKSLFQQTYCVTRSRSPSLKVFLTKHLDRKSKIRLGQALVAYFKSIYDKKFISKEIVWLSLDLKRNLQA